MVFNLSKLNNNENIVLSSTDEIFTNTSLANQGFSIEIQKINRADGIDMLTGSVDSEGNISNGQYSRALFIASIVAVDGFVDENQQPITIEDGIREILWEYGDDLLIDAVKSKIKGFKAYEEKKSESQEPGLENTQVTQ